MAKSRSAFYQQKAQRYQSREVQAKTYNVGELVLRLPDKKKDKLNPKWEGPLTSTKSLPAVHTVYATHLTTDSSQTHGTQPVSEDSTPSAGLRVRLLPPSTFHIFSLSLFSLLFPPSFSTSLLRADLRFVRTHSMCYSHSLYLGASLTEAYLYGLHAQHMCQTSACTPFFSPLYSSI